MTVNNNNTFMIDRYIYLLYWQECFSGKKTTRKVRTKLYILDNILTSEDIDDVISRTFQLEDIIMIWIFSPAW